MIPGFLNLLNRMQVIQQKKGVDYATKEDPFLNFKHSAQLVEWFGHPIDIVFVTLISTKLTRLANLLNREDPPANESIDDSFLDLCTYCALWASYHEEKQKSEKVETEKLGKG